MPNRIALLRGVNLGGHKKVAMPELRNVVASLGHADVATYIQSGNVIFSSDSGDTGQLAADLERAIADNTGVQAGVVVLTRDELAQVTRDSPYASEPNPRFVHVIFLPADPDPELAARLSAAEQQAAQKGSRDTVQLVGRAVFLHTPDGYGTSELARLLGRAGARCPPGSGAPRATGPRSPGCWPCVTPEPRSGQSGPGHAVRPRSGQLGRATDVMITGGAVTGAIR